jgi:hypothetical protein
MRTRPTVTDAGATTSHRIITVLHSVPSVAPSASGSTPGPIWRRPQHRARGVRPTALAAIISHDPRRCSCLPVRACVIQSPPCLSVTDSLPCPAWGFQELKRVHWRDSALNHCRTLIHYSDYASSGSTRYPESTEHRYADRRLWPLERGSETHFLYYTARYVYVYMYLLARSLAQS